MSILVLAIVAIVAFFVSRSIVNQLGGEPAAAIELMSRAASGDLTVDVRSSSRGSILESAGEMVRAIRKMVSEITHSSTALTNGAERISTASREVAVAVRCDLFDGCCNRGNDGQHQSYFRQR